MYVHFNTTKMDIVYSSTDLLNIRKTTTVNGNDRSPPHHANHPNSNIQSSKYNFCIYNDKMV